MQSQNVTESHEPSQAVTNGHVESRSVTLCCAELCCADPISDLSFPTETIPDPVGSEVRASAPPVQTVPVEKTTGQEREVFAYWVEARVAATHCKPESLKFTSHRRSKVRARLREGYTAATLKLAIDGCFGMQFNVEGGHTDLELICRDAPHVDRYAAKGATFQAALQAEEQRDSAEGRLIHIPWSKAVTQ